MSNRSNFIAHPRNFDYIVIPVEALPIPFNITEVGRAYVARLRAMEAQVERESVSLRNSELHSQQRFHYHCC